MSDPSDQVGIVVHSVNVGRPRRVEWHGRTVVTAIFKEPVAGPVVAEGVNLRGDDQADRRVHGGVDKAVYAYALEDYEWWSRARQASGAQPFGPATFGENITTAGIDLRECRIGDRWRVGSTVLEVAQPRSPCFKLGIRVGDDGFPDEFERAGRAGAYLRIVTGGSIEAGDTIEVEPADGPAVTLGALFTGALDRDGWQRVADDPRVPGGWRRVARRAVRDSAPDEPEAM